jgi:uncharacterized protein (TIRG00374 family)
VIKYYFYKKLKVPSSTIVFLIAAWTMLFYAAAVICFIFCVFFSPKAGYDIPVNTVLFLLAAILIVSYALVKRGNKAFLKILNFFAVLANKFLVKFFKQKPVTKERLHSFNLKLTETFSEMKSSKRDFFFAACAAMVYYLSDIVTVYFAFLVFGFHANIFLIIFAFTVSSILSYMTSIPYIPGVVESSLVMMFVKVGFPAHISLMAALLFRIFSYWFPMPIGLVSYLDFRRESANSGKNQENET